MDMMKVSIDTLSMHKTWTSLKNKTQDSITELIPSSPQKINLQT